MWMQTLRAKFAIANILPILVLMPLLSLYLLYSFEELFVDKMMQRLSFQSGLLIEQVEESPTVVQNAQAAQQFLAGVARNTDARIILLSKDGTVLASTRPEDSDWIGSQFRPPSVDQALQGQHTQGSGSGFDTEVVYVALPIHNQPANNVDGSNDDGITGVLHLSYAIDDIRAEFSYLRWVVLGGVSFTVLLALALALTLSTTVTDPIHQLTDLTHGIANGEYQVRIPIQRQDEIGMLAQSFNQMAERIEEGEKLRQSQLAAIEHELTRPLAGMRAAVETLSDGAANDVELRTTLLNGLGEEIARLERLLNTLHHFDRHDVRPLKVRQSVHDLAHVIQASIAHSELVAAKQGISLTRQIPQHLPPVYVDEDRLTQLLINLIDNALKFTSPGGFVEVQASEDIENDAILVSVTDSGTGIAPEELPHLFHQLYRNGESSPQKKHGMGLGLTICREIVAAHGGKIWAESTLGEGSRFFFMLPTAQARESTFSRTQE